MKRITGELTAKDRAGKSWFVPVGVLQNIAGNAQFTVLTSIVMAFRIWLSGEVFRETGWRLPRF